MEQTNKQFANTPRTIADLYEYESFGDDITVERPSLTIYPWTKDNTVAMLKRIGGRFTKSIAGEFMYLKSVTYPGLVLSVMRDSVCEKKVTYDCKPLLSPEEETESGIVVEEAVQA